MHVGDPDVGDSRHPRTAFQTPTGDSRHPRTAFQTPRIPDNHALHSRHPGFQTPTHCIPDTHALHSRHPRDGGNANQPRAGCGLTGSGRPLNARGADEGACRRQAGLWVSGNLTSVFLMGVRRSWRAGPRCKRGAFGLRGFESLHTHHPTGKARGETPHCKCGNADLNPAPVFLCLGCEGMAAEGE